jgi:predicted CoA-binding protein
VLQGIGLGPVGQAADSSGVVPGDRQNQTRSSPRPGRLIPKPHNGAMTEAHDTIGRMLDGTRTIAVVGLSPSPNRPSNGVAAYLQRQGFRVIPVNPNVDPDEILGERAYPDLASVPEPIDLVNIFRRSEFIGPVVAQAIEIGAKYVWMQDGVIDDDAAEVARSAGLLVVMNDCIFRQHRSRSIA